MFRATLIRSRGAPQQRYPTLFSALPDNGIHNKVTGETYENVSSIQGVDALKIVSRLVDWIPRSAMPADPIPSRYSDWYKTIFSWALSGKMGTYISLEDLSVRLFVSKALLAVMPHRPNTKLRSISGLLLVVRQDWHVA